MRESSEDRPVHDANSASGDDPARKHEATELEIGALEATLPPVEEDAEPAADPSNDN